MYSIRSRFALALVAFMATAAVSTVSSPLLADESITPDQLPEAVLATARNLVPTGRFNQIERVKDEHRGTVYRIYWSGGSGSLYVMLVAQDGTLLERWFI